LLLRRQQEGYHLRCQKESELAGLLDRIGRLASYKFLPFLEQNAEPRKVLELYLRYDEKGPPPFLRSARLAGLQLVLNGLILARLYGPEHYAALKKR
jgi:hypothetical protein